MVSIKERGGLHYLDISNKSAQAQIALQGAHLFHFQIKGKRPLLWLSESSYFEKGKPIRGGVPICWPWFGAHKRNKSLPNHGFARTSFWEHAKTQERDEQETKVTLVLKSSQESLKLWPYEFELTLDVTVGQKLTLSLTSKNSDAKPFCITQALHSYFSISDISKVCIEGLEKKHYYNKVDGSYENIQEGRLYFTQETDRVYKDISSPLRLIDKEQTISLCSEGSRTAVIWNPGEELAKKMADLSDYRSMLCIESANALDDEIVIQPGKSHTITAVVEQS